jgi:TM2 domain-containing membrane protein YozV
LRVSKGAVVSSGPQPAEYVELKDPIVAGILGWLVPGLGHLYQGRTAKGLLFMICILSTFFYGLFLSDGRAVYASWADWHTRLPYLCPIGTGLPAAPALLQSYLVRQGKAPLMGGIMAPPVNINELNDWHRELHRYLELGTVYTMIAGLLNVLAIYDAWGGPVQLVVDDKKKRPDEPPGPPDAPDS